MTMMAETKRPATTEIGATGTTFFSGSLAENEYNTDLRGAKGRAVYDKMRRSDSRVKAALMVCELPIRAATWAIEPATEDARDIEIAEALEANLMEGMSITWDSFLHHALLMLPFGFMCFEKVWEITDEGVRFAKLAPRLPSSLYQWNLDDRGGLLGIRQFVMIGTSFQFVDIPVEKMLVFTNDKEGSNFEGQSLLRAAYQPWYYKTQLYRIDGIAAERHALGIPTLTLPTGASDTDKTAADAALRSIYAHERQYLRMSEGQVFDVKGFSGTVRDIMPSIQHHDRKIAESVLATFLDLGGGDTGSWALSKDQSGFFLLALKAVATNITDTVNAYAIKPWVDYNYADVEKYPKLSIGKLETRDIEKYVTAVSGLITSGGLTPDRDTENKLREALELPELPEDVVPVGEKPKQVVVPGMPKEETLPGSIPDGISRLAQGVEGSVTPLPSSRALTPAEQMVNFAEIDQTLNKAIENTMVAIKAIQQRQIAKLAEVAMAMIQKKDFARLVNIDVPFRSEVAEVIEKELLRLYDYGREQVRREIASQVKLVETPIRPASPDLVKAFLASRARAASNGMAAKLKNAVVFNGMNQIKGGVADKALLEEAMAILSEKDMLTAIGHVVPEAFEFGRSTQAEEMAVDIATVQYSAILDQNTCEYCARMDGQEWDFSDSRTDEYAAGNPNCEGRGYCRCILVYISRSERRNPNG